MSNSKWIPIEDARDLIAERSEKTLGTDWLSSCTSAWNLIVERLKAGDLPARPSDPDKFRFTLQSEKEAITILLNPDGTIPGSFWWSFCHAAENTPDLATLRSETYAEKLGGRFYFRDRGRNSGILEGEVFDVLVPRMSLPGNLPNPRGRPAHEKFDDTEIVKAVECAIAHGDMKRGDAIKKFAPKMQRIGSLEGAERRLRSRLKSKSSRK